MNHQWIAAAAAACMLLTGSFSAEAAAGEGILLGKDGVPVQTQEQPAQGPRLVSQKMDEKTEAVQNAMAELPHSRSAVVRFTVDESGHVEDASVLESSGQPVLDSYAAASVREWTFRPALENGRAVSSRVSVPIRFVSTKVAVPAAPLSQNMPDWSGEVKKSMEAHPEGLDVFVSCYIESDGTVSDIHAVSVKDAVLEKYAEKCIGQWKFQPARNPDGEAVGSRVMIPVRISAK